MLACNNCDSSDLTFALHALVHVAHSRQCFQFASPGRVKSQDLDFSMCLTHLQNGIIFPKHLLQLKEDQMLTNVKSTTLMIALFCVINLCYANTANAEQPNDLATVDPVKFSFAFFGCNRLDKEGVESTHSDSTANIAQLLQSFKDIANSPVPPNYLFLAGDIVKGKKPGTKKLSKELAEWVKLVSDPNQNPLIQKNIPIVAFTGNHELLVNQEDGKNCIYAQCPNPPAYLYWQDYMGKTNAFIFGKNGPVTNANGGKDDLLTDEKRLSYSFRSGDVFFIILNTDTQIDAVTIGDIPLHWIKQQLKAAQQDHNVNHIFVMGHKPLLSSDNNGSDTTGNGTIRSAEAEAFYALLNNPAGDNSSTSKVRIFLAAHAHEWNYMPKMTVGNIAGIVPQIIAGNGGSPPNSSWLNDDAYFGYTLVEITQSGVVTAKSFGRPFDTKEYYKQSPIEPATLRATYTLYTPGNNKQVTLKH